ncbi:hypothetical protein [Sphaerobacter sp.]|uniref:hypothetical protein n=1 Tax=Sphaerobacter sp. TaxID=2099654 RepID=UPI001E06876D|nr:hypothetical protein [Sphaerobacter sp.]MBX5445137.1 hypothetical protein [Sphaerobacter sp.]
MRNVDDGGPSQELTNGNGALPDVSGLDSAAAREFAAWTDFLAGLHQAQSHPQLPSISSALGPPEWEPVARWYVVLRGVRRLTEVAGLREHLEGLPPCLAVRVVDLSSQEVRIMVAVTPQTGKAGLEEEVKVALRGVESAATFEVVPATPR